MPTSYRYLTATLERDRVLELRAWLLAASRAEAGTPLPGTRLWGSWLGAGSIGWFDDQVVVISFSVGGAQVEGADAEWLASGPGVTGVECVTLQPTARPTHDAPLERPGAYAHRWFDVRPADVDEIVSMSADAWPAFEAGYDAQVQGLFRSGEEPSRLLLVTRYASVAEWERSRGVGQAREGALGNARSSFERRRALTGRQVVRVANLVW
ncbi:MAG: hypothetical protein ACYCZV_01015 [Acidimicrobiales bacterium]